MSRRCDLCGADMVLRSRDSRQDADEATASASTESWWDCGCGRTVMEFSASASATVTFTVEDERE